MSDPFFEDTFEHTYTYKLRSVISSGFFEVFVM